jgi:hypothetical protein
VIDVQGLCKVFRDPQSDKAARTVTVRAARAFSRIQV